MVRQKIVLGCTCAMMLALVLPAAAEDTVTLPGLKSTDAAALGDVRGSVVAREKSGASQDQPGKPEQDEERVTEAFVSAEDTFGGPDADVTKELGGAGAGLTSGVGGAFGSLEGLSPPVARSVAPTNNF